LSVRAKALVFEDPASRALWARIQRLAPSDAPVLIHGETGTGKELVARQLHALSRRADCPFVAVNAGAFSQNLVESELFGHEKGAFTGAHAARAGWFEAAHGGTLFLDEIGDLPLELQVKLLRVLQEGEVTRVGSRQAIPINVRLIAATNVDLQAAIRAKHFREDLFYRLNVTSLALPPLRDRPRDILALAQHFLRLYQQRLSQSGVTLGESAVERLLTHPWPGNIRELENAIHHALLVRQHDELTASDLHLPPVSVPDTRQASNLGPLARALSDLLSQSPTDLHAQVEATLLTTTYDFTGHNQLETARLLGLSRNIVRARLIEHGALKGPLRRKPSTPPPSTAALRIGYQKLGLLSLVRGYGAFDSALAARGMRIDWVEYQAGIPMVEALRAGELAAGIVGACPAVFAHAEDAAIVYLAAEPAAPRGSALIVPQRSKLQHVADLRGKRVAVNRAAQAHYLLIKALEEAGVASSDVDVQFLAPERALQAFQTQAIDAWAIWDPWLSSARLDFGARVLRDATGLLHNSSYYLGRRDFAERQPELLTELLEHVELAARWVERDPCHAADRIAPGLGLSSQALLASFERELGTTPLSTEQIAAQQDIADTLLRLQWIPRPVLVSEAQWHG
jgi:aliphatic sulfonates family ABC transporter substrate-binding protein